MTDKAREEEHRSPLRTLYEELKTVFRPSKNVSIDVLPSSLTEENIDREIDELCSQETGLARIKNLFKYE